MDGLVDLAGRSLTLSGVKSRMPLRWTSVVAVLLLGALGSAQDHEKKKRSVVQNEGREAHRGDLSFVVTGGKPAVLDTESQVYADFHAALLRDLDAALQADAQTMHERREFTVRGLPLRVTT